MSRVAVIDFGGQYAHLIARKIRELGVYSEIVQEDFLSKDATEYSGIVVSGGPSSVYDADAPKIDEGIFRLNIPVLGICYGHQLMAHLLGGQVKRATTREYGTATLKLVNGATPLFDRISSGERIWMSHGDMVVQLPPGFILLASTSECTTAAMGDINRRLYGIQFHPEVYHTPCGDEIFRNFLFKVCKCESSWDPEENLEYRLDRIRREVKDRNVFFLVSGGVDSTVAFSLCVKALGEDRVFGLTIDTGLLRKDEPKYIEEVFKKLGVKNFMIANAEKDFVTPLQSVCDPEEKRQIIGEKFLEVQEKVFAELNLSGDNWVLGQGTIYPDTIESGGTPRSEIIKTHHNRVSAIQKFIEQRRLVEPISDLYKDEVRNIGTKLHLPKKVVSAYPFPGPGLAIRCLCSPKSYTLEKLNSIQEIAEPYQLDSAVLPLRSVGVQGDGRTYNKVCVLTGEIELQKLERISTSITNSVREVNRVAFLVRHNGGDLLKARVRESKLTLQRLNLLKEVDSIVRSFVEEKGILKEIWQFPVITIPLSFNGGETIVLRPICSRDGMTAEYYKMDSKLLYELADRVLSFEGVDAVLYDITNKPPATIEWE